MQIVILSQGTPEWLAWRNGGIGSSDAMVIAAEAGMIPTKDWMGNIDELYLEKTGVLGPEKPNPLMERGHRLEPFARATYERQTGEVVLPVCGTMDQDPMMRASFDGISFDGLSYLELKAPNADVHALAREGKVVDYYKPQIAHQALVAWGPPKQWPERGVCRFGSYMPDDEKVPEKGELLRVSLPASAPRFREFAAALYAEEQKFLDALRTGVPPCGQPFADGAKEWLDLKAKEKALKTQIDAIEESLAKIVQSLNRKSLSGLGLTVAKQERKGAIDYAKALAEYGIAETEVERYRKASSEHWAYRAKKAVLK